MIDTFLIPAKTIITAKGDGAAVDVSTAQSPVFLITLAIDEVVEQESLDLAIQGSADGTTWEPKALLVFPQSFYVGQRPMLLDLTGAPEVKFVRAHWDVNRWGRGSEKPSFVAGVTIKEVPPEILRETRAGANTRR